MRALVTAAITVLVLIAGCSSTDTLGLATKSAIDPAGLISSPGHYQTLGPANGKACRYMILGIIPAGDSTVTKAIGNALEKTGGDALVNVSVTSNLYSFVPIYNIFCVTCTTVQGIAIKVDPAAKPPA